MQKLYKNENMEGPFFKKRYKIKSIFAVLIVLIICASCEDYFEPKLTNERTYDQLVENPDYVRGLLTYAYRAIPSAYDIYGGDFLI